MNFEVRDKKALAKLLKVAPQELDYVLRGVDRYYRPAKIPKRDGSRRSLLVPSGKLKLLQQKVKQHILDEIPLLDCVQGGVKRRSAVSNARCHLGQRVVFSVDLKDFFPNVHPERVRKIFVFFGFGEECANLLTKITTWRFQLPQGAATSTALANLAVVSLDLRLFRLAKIHGFAYTRYIDDLTLSGGDRLLDFRNLVRRIVESEGFATKPEKTFTMIEGQRQTVTRLVVNAKVNMPREWRKELRARVLGHLAGNPQMVSEASILGSLNWLAHLNRGAGEALRSRLTEEACRGN
jgi:RNA-directed DNA polymerase